MTLAETLAELLKSLQARSSAPMLPGPPGLVPIAPQVHHTSVEQRLNRFLVHDPRLQGHGATGYTVPGHPDYPKWAARVRAFEHPESVPIEHGGIPLTNAEADRQQAYFYRKARQSDPTIL